LIIKLFEDVQRVNKANVQFGAVVGALMYRSDVEV